MDEQEPNLVLKSLESESVNNLLGPVTKELGLLGGDLAGLVRFYVNGNLEKVFEEWARQRRNRPLGAAEVRHVIPLLQAASLQSDDVLQECWAALLESTVSVPEDVVPSFGQTLSLLSPDEAVFLNRLYNRLMNEEVCELRRLGDFDKMAWIYDPNHNDDVTASQVHLMIQDFERLGLLWSEQRRDEDVSISPKSHKLFQVSSFETVYYFSDYGVRFAQAVTPKTSQGIEKG